MTIRLLVGLGNPGAEYDATRHNAGFWWVDAVASKLGARLSFDRGYHGLVARLNRAGSEPLWLLEPQTFMNLSGKAVAPLARFFKIEPEQILVVHDELDLPPGQAKLKLGGSAAGHLQHQSLSARTAHQRRAHRSACAVAQLDDHAQHAARLRTDPQPRDGTRRRRQRLAEPVLGTFDVDDRAPRRIEDEEAMAGGA